VTGGGAARGDDTAGSSVAGRVVAWESVTEEFLDRWGHRAPRRPGLGGAIRRGALHRDRLEAITGA